MARRTFDVIDVVERSDVPRDAMSRNSDPYPDRNSDSYLDSDPHPVIYVR